MEHSVLCDWMYQVARSESSVSPTCQISQGVFLLEESDSDSVASLMSVARQWNYQSALKIQIWTLKDEEDILFRVNQYLWV